MTKALKLLITLEQLDEHLRIFKANCIFTTQYQTIEDLIEYLNDEVQDILQKDNKSIERR